MKMTAISLVPGDLVVRVVKRMKETGDNTVMIALERAGEATELVRRLIVINWLPEIQLSDKDRIWLIELKKAEKALWGVWQGKVRVEAVAARLALAKKVKPDLRGLYLQSVEDRYGRGKFWGWAKGLLENGSGDILTIGRADGDHISGS